MEQFEAISPAGLQRIDRKGISPRLDSLAGKRIGEIWNGVFRGDETFPVLREMLQERFPDATIVPYTEFPHFPGDDRPAAQQEMGRRIAAIAKEKGCDAIISGNGA